MAKRKRRRICKLCDARIVAHGLGGLCRNCAERPPPTPRQIAQRAAAIRATWSASALTHRRHTRFVGHDAPGIRVVSLDELIAGMY
jgi:hypothetical protein